MRKLYMILLMLCVFATIVYAGIDYGVVENYNKKVLDLRNELSNNLTSKNYTNKVVGSFEVVGDKLKFEAYMVPEAGQEMYSIVEEREMNTFSVLSRFAKLPSKTLGAAPENYLVKGLGIAGVLLLLASTSLLVANRRLRKAKIRRRVKEKKEETQQIAA